MSKGRSRISLALNPGYGSPRFSPIGISGGPD
jgi:hypothetical protein